MLQWLIKIKTYLKLKSGLLLDYYIKIFFLNFFKFFQNVFSLYFFDKYLIEGIKFLLNNIIKTFRSNINTLKELGFLKSLKAIVYIIMYIFIIIVIFWLHLI